MGATKLRAECDLSATRLSAVLNLLEEAGAVRTGREGSRWTGAAGSDDDAVQDALAVDATHRKLEQSRVEMMRGYAETVDCRRRFLLGYFGETVSAPCGACDICTSRTPGGPAGALDGPGVRDRAADRAAAPAAPSASARGRGFRRGGASAPAKGHASTGSGQPAQRGTADHPYQPGVRVRHEQWGEGEVMSEGDGKLTVLFTSVGYRTLSLAVVTDKHLLAALPDPTR